MNSNFGKTSKSASLNNFDFDFGLGTNRPRPLNDQKNQPSSYSSSSFSSTQSKPGTTSSAPSWQPNKPSWTHQPAANQPNIGVGSLNGPTSMVGDIHGRSWASAAPATTGASIGIVGKNPNLFGDLLGSALGQNKGTSNVPLKNVAPASSKSPYSMGNLGDSLPKTDNSVKSSSNWKPSESIGSYTSGYTVKSTNLGGPSMNSNKDPFGSFVDFGMKTGTSTGIGMNSGAKSRDDAFGDFQNASKSSTTAFSSNAFESKSNTMGSNQGSYASKSSTPAFSPNAFENMSNTMGSNQGSFTNLEDFGMPTSQKQKQAPVQSPGVDAFEVLFTSKGSEGLGDDDWGMDSEFVGADDSGGTTTELDGLPPPPSGISASAAKNKGMDNYKQGQYADAIKWLSWAVILHEKNGDDAATMEVLSSRASCYKEVGEYKKAVADCTKVLEHDDKNVAVLVQRALLYESMEKYKLGAEDLRTVMKIDPSNRLARSTVHRLAKMAE